MEKDEGNFFCGKINRRLSIFFAFLFFLLLLSGMLFRYLAQTMLWNIDHIRKESEREVMVDRIDDTFHHFVSVLEQAALRGTPVSHFDRHAYLQTLSLLLETYRAGEEEPNISGQIPQVIVNLGSISEKLTKVPSSSSSLPRTRLNVLDIAGLSEAEGMVQEFSQWRSEIHRARMAEEVRQAQQRMQLISVLDTGLALTGGLLIIASSLFFFQKITKPLRRLVRHAQQISEGDLNSTVPVKSRDEIGQLSYAFNFMVERLKEHEARLKMLATVEERELVAQELHDSLAQDLAILRLKLAEAEKDCFLARAASMKDAITEAKKIGDLTYKNVRQAILGLHPLDSKTLGFVPTLAQYLKKFSELSKIPVDLDIDSPETIRVSPERETQLIRIIHEALTNIFKHAHATRGAVKFERDGDFVRMAIEDNGTGLTPDEGAGTGLRFGLQSMRKRAEGIGGRFSIESIIGKGTKVIVQLPFQERRYEANSNTPGR